jgi:proteic killer suppression protein
MSVTCHITPVIKSFRCKRTAAVFRNIMPKGFPADVVPAARRKLAMLDAATRLEDLRIPPSNRLEALRGDRAGQHSIRVNDQWRVCFVWRDGHAHEVEIVDYH